MNVVHQASANVKSLKGEEMYRGFEIQEVVERKLLATKWNSDEEIIAMFSEEDMTELRKQIDMWHQDQEELAKLWRQINER